MDTGSDLVWFPCSPFQCILCEGKPNPTPKPPNITRSSHTLSCQSPACAAAHSSLSPHDLCALDSIETSDCSSATCPPFYYAYGDGSFVANLYRHTEGRAIRHQRPRDPETEDEARRRNWIERGWAPWEEILTPEADFARKSLNEGEEVPLQSPEAIEAFKMLNPKYRKKRIEEFI